MSAPEELRAVAPESPEAEAARLRIRRRRSIALALALALFAVTFYLLTVVRMGPALFDRSL
jgi:hypothetical protein